VQVQTLVHPRAASESLLKATHEHYEESRLAIREGREERERELEELTATLELVAARGFPEDELATAEMELRQAGIDRNEAQRRRDTEAARADQVRSERDDLERQVQDIETEIETLEAQDEISTDDLRAEQARLKEKIHATRQEVDAEWERELGELDAQAKATNAAQCETNDRARTERMAEEESDNADRVRNMIAEHDEIMAKMHSDFEQQFEDIARAKDEDIARAKDPPSAPV
jgi:chromosome segregation ATPase